MRLIIGTIILIFILVTSEASFGQSVKLDSTIICEFPYEVEAAFPGGKNIWDKYISRTLDSTIPKKKGAPSGIYTVEVHFQVTKTGKIDSISTTTHHGYGMEKETLRVFRQAPRWIPALKNGRYAATWMKHWITFKVCENK